MPLKTSWVDISGDKFTNEATAPGRERQSSRINRVGRILRGHLNGRQRKAEGFLLDPRTRGKVGSQPVDRLSKRSNRAD